MIKYLILLLIFPLFSFGQNAFPFAQGYGKNATGGRGGSVYHVINKNNSGAGSLRQGVEVETGARTIVFDVSGYIDITTPIKIRASYDNITIAGETSPDGIVIRGAGMYIEANNVIIRHIKVSPGEDAYSASALPPTDPDYEPEDAIKISAGIGNSITNIILDHVTANWSADGIVDIGAPNSDLTTTATNITVSNCFFYENVGKNYGTLVQQAYNVTWFRNINAFTDSRNIAVQSAEGKGIQMVNNYIYGAAKRAWEVKGNQTDFIGNVFESGLRTRYSLETFRLENGAISYDIALTKVYLNDNVDDGVDADTSIQPIYSQYLVGTPNYSTSLPIIASSAIKASLIDNVGATLTYDASDIRVMNHIKNGTGDLLADEANIGGYPTRGTTVGYTDADGDDMSDAVEIVLFGGTGVTNLPNSLTDTTWVAEADGSSINSYTNIEKTHFYLAGDLVASFAGVVGTLISNPRTTNSALINN
ncbi:hypothetical protein OAB94_02335 [Flavobacteriaceae bacterium]|nr:hypothetical protein [Flavobacteriaceae bacterium]